MAKKKSDVDELKLHPELVSLFPPMVGDEFLGLKASIKKSGVLTAIIAWRLDDRSQNWIIDGRNRHKAVTELQTEGVTHADNGMPIECGIFQLEGTEKDALDYVVNMNLPRRGLTSSQKAAIFVKANQLSERYAARDVPAEPAMPDTVANAGPDARTFEQMAIEAGTNRTYLFDCTHFRDEAADLLDDVASGKTSIYEARKTYNRRKQGLPDEPSTDEKEAKEEKPKLPDEAKDGLKKPVAVEFVPIFSVRDNFRELDKLLGKAKVEIESICERDGGANVSRQDVIADLTNLRSSLKNNQPHVVCPYCEGSGKNKENSRKKCEQCKGKKFLDKLQYKLLPADLKDAQPETDDGE